MTLYSEIYFCSAFYLIIRFLANSDFSRFVHRRIIFDIFWQLSLALVGTVLLDRFRKIDVKLLLLLQSPLASPVFPLFSITNKQRERVSNEILRLFSDDRNDSIWPKLRRGIVKCCNLINDRWFIVGLIFCFVISSSSIANNSSWLRRWNDLF